ncbi:MAG: SGNH/GDSL hydrolase family protein [Muribaculaceae bacterium]|nr:SGNH/GDSL hydrolase family protein [Muribaculaceae bacterium]
MERLDSTRMTEYMVYLPLYDGIENIEIKVSPNATITPGDSSIIDAKKRIVAYGTSILQGGCASRTGMASTNILSRELNSEVINLGFSGQGKMDSCMARAIARIPDVDLYLLDPVPNCTEAMCDSLTYGFVNIIRAAHPKTPIVMVEGPIYPYARYDSFFGNYLPAKNARYRENFERLKADFPDAPIYYVDSVNLDGAHDDGTVDGIHLTDLGFVHYVDKVLPVIRKALAESPLKN